MKEIGLILFGAIVGFFISRWQSISDRRRLFSSQIDVFLARLRNTQDDALVEFHADTKVPIRDECAKIGRDVCCGCRSRLADAAQEYYALTEDEIIKDPIGKALTERQHVGGRIISPEAEFPGRERMAGLLQKIYGYTT